MYIYRICRYTLTVSVDIMSFWIATLYIHAPMQGLVANVRSVGAAISAVERRGAKPERFMTS